MNANQTRTLLARTGLDPTEAELQGFESRSQNDAAQWLVQHAKRNTAVLALPEWTQQSATLLSQRQAMTEPQRQAYRMAQNQAMQELRQWWLKQMLATSTPLAERMEVFWHNHFVSSQLKVQDAHAMLNQHQLLRKHALGSFREMLFDLAQDPAMLVYLDGAQNRVQAPNENFAREVMELFTLGEGNYTETDVKEAARGFAGWTVNPQTNRFVNDLLRRDTGGKTVLGKAVQTGEDVLNQLLAQPACAKFLVEKLWREFVSPTPNSAAVQRIASRFRDSNYDIATALTALLAEPAVLSPDNEAALVKSPIELLVGTARRFGVLVNDATPLMLAAASMGQILFAPPNVKGWQIGTAWIDANTLLARKQAIARLFGFADPSRPNATMNRMQSQVAANDMTGNAADLPRRFRNPPRSVGKETLATGQVAPMVFDPQVWLIARGIDPLNTVREPMRGQFIAEVLHTAPALPPDSSLEGLPLLRALVADAAYQVK